MSQLVKTVLQLQRKPTDKKWCFIEQYVNSEAEIWFQSSGHQMYHWYRGDHSNYYYKSTKRERKKKKIISELLRVDALWPLDRDVLRRLDMAGVFLFLFNYVVSYEGTCQPTIYKHLKWISWSYNIYFSSSILFKYT